MLSWKYEDIALKSDCYKDDSSYVCGIDEVGRGSLAGPVVACAAVFKSRNIDFLHEIKDSKKLSKSKRDSIFHKLQNNIFYSLGISSNLEIDEINIYQASFLAMKRAYTGLTKYCSPKFALIDGNKTLDISIKSYAIIKGDNKSYSIAAASIIAKVFRDALMIELSKEDNNSCYGWHKNAGYATQQHKQSIEEHGVSKYHRRSFAPIKYLLNND